MTPADEARFIALWTQGIETAEIARQLGLKVTTAQSRAHWLQQQGLIQPRPREGTYPTERVKARAPGDGGPSTVHRGPCTVYGRSFPHGPAGSPDRCPTTCAGPPSHRSPSTVHPNAWELKQLKHSVRWTVYVPQAMKEELQRRAAARGQNPSLLLQEALARWLAEERP